ncbi:MAG: glycosyl hydrolase, partial [Marinilabiliales bacterium]|nr:glycosyl hydrolase [Marinilabiliales bacterium]
YETWTGSGMMFDNLRLVKDAYPNTHLIFTEGCVEKFSPDSVGLWRLGERYAHSMINDFNCGTVTWTDWNILLDMKGGPNHAGNFCFAPVHADLATGNLIYTSSYYCIGHFSKFVRPGAKRIACSSNRDALEATAFVNTDGRIVVVVLNRSNGRLPLHLWIHGSAVRATSLPKSLMTFILS